jgi:N-methylhydantoinase B
MRWERAMTLDPVTLALVQNRLDHISHQMGWVMTRTARSPIFSQSHDFSCFIADARGTLISQADGIPIHTGGGGFAVRAILRDFAGSIEPEDVFLLNDPYEAGGNHLPDWVIARPVFVAGTLVAFACNRAHQADIGGGAAGTYNSAATEIFHEGIRLPVLKLIERGKVRADLWRLLMLNTRLPEALDGDLHAMLGSTRIGAERLALLVEELGGDKANDFFEAVLDHADRRFKGCIERLAHGTWRAEEAIDNDCFEPIDGKITVALTVEDGKLIVDFAGTSAQVRASRTARSPTPTRRSTWRSPRSSSPTCRATRAPSARRDPPAPGQHRQSAAARADDHEHRVRGARDRARDVEGARARRCPSAPRPAGRRRCTRSPPACSPTAAAT